MFVATPFQGMYYPIEITYRSGYGLGEHLYHPMVCYHQIRDILL